MVRADASSLRPGGREAQQGLTNWSSLLLFAAHDRSVVDSLRAWMRTSRGPPDLAAHVTPAWMDRVAAAFDTTRARTLARRLARGNVWVTPTTYFSAYLMLMPLDSAIVRDERLAYLPPDVRALTSAVLPPERFIRPARATPGMRLYARRAQLLRLWRPARRHRVRGAGARTR